MSRISKPIKDHIDWKRDFCDLTDAECLALYTAMQCVKFGPDDRAVNQEDTVNKLAAEIWEDDRNPCRAGNDCTVEPALERDPETSNSYEIDPKTGLCAACIRIVARKAIESLAQRLDTDDNAQQFSAICLILDAMDERAIETEIRRRRQKASSP